MSKHDKLNVLVINCARKETTHFDWQDKWITIKDTAVL